MHISPCKAADGAPVAGFPGGHGHRPTARFSAARAVRRQVTQRRGSVRGCAKTREPRRGSAVPEIPSGSPINLPIGSPAAGDKAQDVEGQCSGVVRELGQRPVPAGVVMAAGAAGHR